jgi:aminopeptidase N
MRFYLVLFIVTFSFAQPIKTVDFSSVLGDITIDPTSKMVSGKVTYLFEVFSPTDTIKIDARDMTFSNLLVNNSVVKYSNPTNKLVLFEGFNQGKNSISFEYAAYPKQAMYFIGSNENLQIWTQGQGKNTSHWFPSFDDPNEKVIFNLDINFISDFQVISNGVLQNKLIKKDTTSWSYRMKNPMSSYLLMLAIGKFEVQSEVSKSGIPLQFYIEKGDISKLEPTYRYSKKIFDFLEQEIGILYPWEVYKQVPVRDFLYAGMENTSATLFSRDFVVDEIGFVDRNYVNVNAHELAHQWFGNLITAASGTHHWLHEGFATYYALLAEQEVFGADYFNYKLYQTAQQLAEASKFDKLPILNEKASSLTFYQKGAWALHVLREGVGEKVFHKAVKNYLNAHAFLNVTTDSFFEEIRKLSTYDLESYKKKWLESPDFDSQQALGILKKSKTIRTLLEIQEKKSMPFNDQLSYYKNIISSTAFDPLKTTIIYQIEKLPFNEKASLLHLAMQSQSSTVRQAILTTTTKIPVDFKDEFESTLFDNSYVTQEISLGIHWKNFPLEQKNLLSKSSKWVGFNDKNLRILWLTLALRTVDFEPGNKAIYYDELLRYSAPIYESSTRQNALENLLFIDDADKNYLPNLINALGSHQWQFSKFAKEKIRLLLKKEGHRSYFSAILSSLQKNEAHQLQRLLDEK